MYIDNTCIIIYQLGYIHRYISVRRVIFNLKNLLLNWIFQRLSGNINFYHHQFQWWKLTPVTIVKQPSKFHSNRETKGSPTGESNRQLKVIPLNSGNDLTSKIEGSQSIRRVRVTGHERSRAVGKMQKLIERWAKVPECKLEANRNMLSGNCRMRFSNVQTARLFNRSFARSIIGHRPPINHHRSLRKRRGMMKHWQR